MSDYGHTQTERELKKLEKALTAQYGVARKELTAKLEKYFEKFVKEDAENISKLNNNEITESEYLQWRQQKMLTGKKWTNMRDTIAQDLTNVNKISASMITDAMGDAYALNANYGAYEIEKGANINLSFSLYNKATVNRMIKDKKFPIPTPKVDVPKDLRWNKQKINSAMVQGVLQGESVKKIAKRLQSVTDMNNSSAIRNARTYITGAENRGRVDSYKYAESLGIELEQMWIATHDGKTRDSHRRLDGMTAKIGEQFPNGCEYPGDPDGPDEEIYNCRCTLIADLKNHKMSAEKFLDRKADAMDEEEYKKWKNEHEEEQPKLTVDTTGPMRDVPRLNNPADRTTDNIINDVNKKYSTGKREYRDNCANCIVADELRYRGYDVYARARDYSRNSNIDCWWKSDKFGNGGWTDSFKDLKHESINVSRKKDVVNAVTKKMQEYGDNSRAALWIQWDGKTVGHYFNVVNEGGEVKFIDTQNSRMGNYVEDYFNRARPSKTTIWRLDDKELTDFARKVVEWDAN